MHYMANSQSSPTVYTYSRIILHSNYRTQQSPLSFTSPMLPFVSLMGIGTATESATSPSTTSRPESYTEEGGK